MRIVFLATFILDALFRHFYIDNYNILWYIIIIQLLVHHLQSPYLHRTRC